MTLDRAGERTARPRTTRTARTIAGRSSAAPGDKTSRSPFAGWLRVQLRARRMSQRQLASRSGVSHATISRLLNEDREPSLGTAMDLARVLLDLGSGADEEQYLAMLSAIRNDDPARRVAYALRADEAMDEVATRRVMDYYLAIRRTAAQPRDRSA
jgi:transcriptional regulator with XRE-family HTH domain